MGSRKQAAKLILQSRKAFYHSESIEKALQYVNEALELLDSGETTPSFVAWAAFLYGVNHRKTPDHLRALIPDDIRYLHLKMVFFIQDKNYSEAHRFFDQLTRQEQVFKKKAPLLYRELLAVFMDAENLFFLKEKDRAFEIISTNLKNTDEAHLGEKSKLIIARAYVILGEYYQKRGMTTLAEAMMRKAFLMIEDSRVYFVTSELYIRIAEFYVVNFPSAKGLNLLERLSQISDFFPHKKMLIKIETQWLFYYIYAGNTESFWERLQEIKQWSKQENDNQSLANIYYLEAMFHFYNKDLINVVCLVNKALALNPNEDIVVKCKRLQVISAFILSTHNEGNKRLEEISGEYLSYGFNKFIDFYKTTDKEEMEVLFNSYFKHDFLWVEEILLSFYRKFIRVIPETFHSVTRKLIADYKNSGLKLSYALLNEAYGKANLYLEDYEEARIHLGKAQMVYKKTGFLKAAKEIEKIIPANEINLLELRDQIELFIDETGDKAKKTVFHHFKRMSDNYFNRLKVMNEILEFSRNIDITDNSVETLKQILFWITSLSKAKSGMIILLEKEQIKNHFETNFNPSIVEKTVENVLEMSNRMSFTPLCVKRTYIIDETKKIILFVEDSESSEQDVKFFLPVFLNQIESILALFVKNTLYLQNSMYDSLTGLYSRWYYEERFKEEFEKAVRYKIPLSYIIGDIDSFKLVNDNYGHQTGDEVLKEISKIFLTVTRKFDIVARYGGEEISIILPNTNVEGAFKVAEKIRSTIEEITLFPFNTTMSFGVDSMEKDEYDEYKELEKRGDIALYVAKEHGKNRVEQYNHHLMHPTHINDRPHI